MREGILGGSFDPIHNGHLFVARQCLDKLKLDRVLFVPARVPPHKRGARLSAPEHRLAMVTLALADIPEFAASDAELRRTGPSYTTDTVIGEVERLGDGAELFLLMGADQALEIHTWYKVQELLGACTVVPVTRPGFSLADLDGLKEKMPESAVEQLKRSAIEMEGMDISSTDIRRRVRAGTSIAALVSEPVERYIAEHRLYLDNNSPLPPTGGRGPG